MTEPSTPVRYEGHAVFATEYRVKLDMLGNLMQTLRAEKDHSNAPLIQQVTKAYTDLLERAAVREDVEYPPSPQPCSSPISPNDVVQMESLFRGYTLKAIRNFSSSDWEKLRVMPHDLHCQLITHWMRKGALAALHHAQTTMKSNWIGDVMEASVSSEMKCMIDAARNTGHFHMLFYLHQMVPTMTCSQSTKDQLLSLIPNKHPTLLYHMGLCAPWLTDHCEMVQKFAYTHDPDAADWDTFNVDFMFSPSEEKKKRDALLTRLKSSSPLDLQALSAEDWTSVGNDFGYDQYKSLLLHWATQGALGTLHYAQIHKSFFLCKKVFLPEYHSHTVDIIQAAMNEKQWHMVLYMSYKLPSGYEPVPDKEYLIRQMREATGASTDYAALVAYVRRHDPHATTYSQIKWTIAPMTTLSQCLTPATTTTEEPFIALVHELTEKSLSEIRTHKWSGALQGADFVDLFELLLGLVTRGKLSVLDHIQSVEQFDLVGVIFSEASESQLENLVRLLSKPGRRHFLLYMKLLLCEPYSQHFPDESVLLQQLTEEHPLYLPKAALLTYAMTHDPEYESWVSDTNCLQRLASL